MDGGTLGQLSQRLCYRVEGLSQQRRVVAVCRSGDGAQGDAFCVHRRGAFGTPLSPVYRASASLLATARGLCDAAVHRHIRQFQPDEAIVGFEGQLPQGIHRPQFDPLVASVPKRGSRARPVGDPLVSAAEHQHLHQLLEDHVIGDAGTVTTERMVDLPLRQQGGKLLPDGLDEVRWERGHGHPPSSGSVENSPDDGASRARLPADALPIRASSYSMKAAYQPNQPVVQGSGGPYDRLVGAGADSLTSNLLYINLLMVVGLFVLSSVAMYAGAGRHPDRAGRGPIRLFGLVAAVAGLYSISPFADWPFLYMRYIMILVMVLATLGALISYARARGLFRYGSPGGGYRAVLLFLGVLALAVSMNMGWMKSNSRVPYTIYGQSQYQVDSEKPITQEQVEP